MNKLTCIRHGNSIHNELAKQFGTKAYYMKESLDSALTDVGIKQALDLNSSKNEYLNELDVIFISPSYRTLQTAEIVFTGLEKKMIVLDQLKEYPNGLETTNKRKTKTFLKSRFPKFNFDKLQEDDVTYNKERLETREELKVRIKNFKEFINQEKYKGKKIGIVGHTTFLSNFIWDKDVEMEHCKIYEKLIF